MALESSGAILYVAKFRINRITGMEIVRGGPNLYTDTHTQTNTHGGPFYKSCFSAKMQKQD